MPMPFSPSPPSSVCSLVLLLYSQSPTLRLLFLVQSIASVTSLIALVLGMLHLFTRRPFVPMHQGTTILILNLCLSLLLGNVGVLLSSLYHLHVPLFRPTSSHCFWLSFSFGDCLMIRSLFNVSLLSAYSSGVCLALERVVGSLLLLRNRRAKWVIAASLAILQWLLSLLAVLPSKEPSLPPAVVSSPAYSSTSPSRLFPHCAMVTPSPTQLHPHFFVLLGMQAFVLAIFSILTYHNHFDPVTKSELSRGNSIVHEQVLATEQSLPTASFVVALFLLNTVLDCSFLRAIVKTFGGGEINEKGGATEGTLRGAMWNELQNLALPLASFFFAGVLFLQNKNQWRPSTDERERNERMGNGEMVRSKSKEGEQETGGEHRQHRTKR